MIVAHLHNLQSFLIEMSSQRSVQGGPGVAGLDEVRHRGASLPRAYQPRAPRKLQPRHLRRTRLQRINSADFVNYKASC